MPLSKIKSEFLSKRVAFGKTAAPLYKIDADELAIIALESNNKNLLRYFETPMPELDVLKKARTEAALRRANEDPNKERKQQRPDIEQNKQDPNLENKQSN